MSRIPVGMGEQSLRRDDAARSRACVSASSDVLCVLFQPCVPRVFLAIFFVSLPMRSLLWSKNNEDLSVRYEVFMIEKV